jgi:hypothetical protein
MYFHFAFRQLITPFSLIDVSQAILGSKARFPRACLWLHKYARDFSEPRAKEFFCVAALQKLQRHKTSRSLVRARKECHNFDAPQLATVASGAVCASVFCSLQTRYLWRFEHARGGKALSSPIKYCNNNRL